MTLETAITDGLTISSFPAPWSYESRPEHGCCVPLPKTREPEILAPPCVKKSAVHLADHRSLFSSAAWITPITVSML